MNEFLQTVADAFKERFEASVEEFRGEVHITLGPEHIVAAAKNLRDEFQFPMLIDITAVDYWPQEEPRFHAVYHMYSFQNNVVLQLRVPLNGNSPRLHTIEGVYPNANWFERELWDMFGFIMDGHSDPRRILMPFDWEGHPLRKDYPLGYEEVQFTFNIDEIQRRKPNPKL